MEKDPLFPSIRNDTVLVKLEKQFSTGQEVKESTLMLFGHAKKTRLSI